MLSNSHTNLTKTRQLRLCYYIRPESDHAFLLPDVFGGPFTGPCPPDVMGRTCGGEGCPHAHWEKGFASYSPLDLDGVDGSGDAYNMRPGAFAGLYFQSFKYFYPVKDQVKELFRFHDSTKTTADQFIRSFLKRSEGEDVVRSKVTLIGVHIRRTENLFGVGSVDFPPEGYLDKAMKILETKRSWRSQLIYVVVAPSSEEWVEKFFKSRGKKAIYAWSRSHYDASGGSGGNSELAILASCDHMITTVGSFSWWAGWLSGGTVVYYRDHLNMSKPENRKQIVYGDLWPEEWVGITAEDIGKGE